MPNLTNPSLETRLAAESDQSRLSNRGDLYFVRVKRGPVKVGRSRNVPARLRVLQCASSRPLVLLGSLPGAGWQERLWHATFNEQRQKGEWFDFTGDLRRAIELAVAGGDWTEALQPWPRCDWDDELFPGIDNPRQHYAREMIESCEEW